MRYAHLSIRIYSPVEKTTDKVLVCFLMLFWNVFHGHYEAEAGFERKNGEGRDVDFPISGSAHFRIRLEKNIGKNKKTQRSFINNSASFVLFRQV